MSASTTRSKFFATAVGAVLATLFIATSVVAVYGQDIAGKNKKVLLFFNNDSFTATQIEMERAVRATLKSDPNVSVELFSEYVGNTRTGTDYEDEFVDLMRRKYEGKKFDVIFAFTNAPLNILLRNRQEMFPEAPIIFITLDQRDVAAADLGAYATAVSGKINFKQNLELALAQHPATKRVVLIGGLSVTDKYWAERAQQDFQEFTSRVEFTNLTGLSVAEMRKELSNLPPDTLVFFVTTVLDHLGNTFESPDYLRQIATASNAPIYGTTDAQLGNGIVGGWLVSFNSLGIEGGKVGLRLLAGEKIQDVPPRVIADSPLFDWRELQRWNISESSLPEGSVIQFKQPSLWEEYKWYAIGLSAAVIVETILIAFLLYLRYRRRQAEDENVRLSGRLAEIVSNVPGIVWESRTAPGSNRRTTTFISDYVQRMLGYAPQEWLQEPPGFGLEMIPEEERERVLRESDEVIATGKETVSEFRWFTKDGRIRWVENHIAPIFDNGKGIVGLRGVALDVSDRKLAEKKARETEEKDRAILAAIPDLMFIQTVDGIYLDYHAKHPSDLLVSPETFLGRNMSEILPPDLAGKLAECFARVKEKAEPEILEYSLDTREGSKWFEARMVRSGDKILSVIRDITDRINALDELVRSEERFGKAFRANPQPMSITTVADGRFIDVNDAFGSVSGYTREDVIGRTAADVGLWRSPDDRERFIAAIQTNGSVVNLETEFRAKNGEFRQLLTSAERVQLGGQDCFLIASTDITERHAAQRALQESEARLLLAHQASRMGTFEWNIQTGTNIWSPELEEMYGLARGAFAQTQAAWEDLVHPDDRDSSRSLVESALETGEPAEGEWRVICPDGSIHWIFGRFQVFKDGAGKPLRLAGINIDVTERKAAEEALRESESFNRAILASLNTHVCVLDGVGRIISVNHSWAAFALDNGLSSDASVGPGVNYFDVCWRAAKEGEELAQLALDGVRAVCDGTREYFQLEYPCHSPEEKRWFLMIVTRLKGSKGGAVVVHNDITDSKLAAEAIRESEARFRNMAETAPVIIWMSDEEQSTTYLNRQWMEFTGSDLEKETGFEWTRHVHPDDLTAALGIYSDAFERREPFEIEFRARRTDGVYRWLVASGAPRFTPEGKFLGFIGIGIDITDRKAAAEALKLSESRLRMAQHAARVGTWEWEIETGASVWSEMVWELLGLEPNDGDVTVKRFIDFIHEEDRERAWRNVNKVIADGGEYDDEFRVVRGDGSVLWLASKGALIRSEDGKPERMLGVNMDITELKRTQLEAQEISGLLISAQEHERARLARELHDDACQNLALLSIELELLLRIPLTDAETVRSNISMLSTRVGELSDDLRQMSHQLHPARLVRLGLGSALRGFCNEIESAHALKVEFVEDSVPAILPAATSLNIYRIVQESLQNVVKHSHASRASVTISAKDDVLRLSISDNGCGFDPKNAAPDGSLGLISMRERVRLLHGEISIDSEPGSPTRIKATIPIEQN